MPLPKQDCPSSELQVPGAIEYLLDREDVIIAISGPWDVFAVSNEGKQLAADRVIGQSLFNFISGKVTKQCWLDVFSRVREAQMSASVEYRCDAPSLKRFMHLQIKPEKQGRLRLLSRLIRQEPAAQTIQIQCAQQRTKQSCVRCSICNRVSQQGNWLEVEQISNLPRQASLWVTYGVCPICREMLASLPRY